MRYDFKCSECEHEEEIEIPMDKIKELQNEQKCSKCGAKTERVWKVWGGTTLCPGMYGIDSGKGWTS